MSRKKNQRKVVVYSASRNLYRFLPAAYNSLLAHTSVDCVYILAEDDILPFKTPECVKVINVSSQDYFIPNGPNWSSQFTHMALIRGAYAKLFPDEDLILQLDVDTIVIDDISHLWDIDYTKHYISCVQEFLGSYRPYGPAYYNIGVCMFNLAKLRADGLDQKLIDLLNTEKLTYIEQDALNQLCSGSILPMEVRYNATVFTGQPADTCIEHFAGNPHWTSDSKYIQLANKYNG